MQFSFRCIHAARHTPIPARSPAEREGQNGNETRREGRQRSIINGRDKEEGWRDSG